MRCIDLRVVDPRRVLNSLGRETNKRLLRRAIWLLTRLWRLTSSLAKVSRWLTMEDRCRAVSSKMKTGLVSSLTVRCWTLKLRSFSKVKMHSRRDSYLRKVQRRKILTSRSRSSFWDKQRMAHGKTRDSILNHLSTNQVRVNTRAIQQLTRKELAKLRKESLRHTRTVKICRRVNSKYSRERDHH